MSGPEAPAKEALNSGPEAKQELDRKIEEALACPCVEDVREGPCGTPFKEAFGCYVRNLESETLGDCYSKFEAMHICMGNNPDSFSKFGSEAMIPATKS